MRILHINETLGFSGGAEQYLFDVAEGLNLGGHENCLVFQSRDNQDPGGFARPFAATFSPRSNKPGDSATFIQRFHPDVIYVHRWEAIDNLHLSGTRIPCVRIFHDQDVLCLRTSKLFYWTGQNCYRPIGLRCMGCLPFSKKAWRRGVLTWPKAVSNQRANLYSHNSFAHLVVGSQFMKKQFVKNGIPSGQISVLPLFTNFSPHYCPRPDPDTILFVGRVDRGKGLDLLLKALRFVETDFRLVIAGEGNELAKTKALAKRLHLNGKVQFLGGIRNREKISELYSQSLLVAVPSRWAEPCGLVPLEAMAHGRPVVAFRTGGLGEEIQDGKTGYLVDEQDIQSFAKKITHLLMNPSLCIEMGRAGVERIESYYNKANHLSALLKIFRQSLGLPLQIEACSI